MEKTADKKDFRIHAKKIFLTYSQVDPVFTINNVLEQLEYKLGKVSYIISKENHNDSGVHFHVLLIRTKKFSIRSPYLLDLEFNGKVIHGNYKPVSNLGAAVHYACKDKQYITNLENLQDGELLTPKQFIYQQVQLKGVEKALLEYSQTHKETAIAGISISALKRHFNDIKNIEIATKIDAIDTPFTLKDFEIDSVLKEWIENPIRTLILVGETGNGKTQFCKAFVKEKCSKTLLVNHKEDFKRLDDTYDSMIMDDANIEKLEATQLLSLIDNQVGKTLRVMYNTVYKKKGIIQMIAMNKREFKKIYSKLKEGRILRRIIFKHVKSNFIVNVNLNIQNNIYNNVTNNHYNIESDKVGFKQVKQIEQERIERNAKLMNEYYLSGKE